MDCTVGGPLIPTVPQNVLNQEAMLQDSLLLNYSVWLLWTHGMHAFKCTCESECFR